MYIPPSMNRMMVPFIMSAAALNIGLNVALIPVLGLLGAALATFISYVLLAAAAWVPGFEGLKQPFPVADVVKFSVLGLAMYLVVELVELPVPMRSNS
jgi:O-antigen/teichoic acid export membrane protein